MVGAIILSACDNSIGLPYILMKAMCGKRLWGRGQADFISYKHKETVYHQIANILLQLYTHPLDAIGMLSPAGMNLGAKLGLISNGSQRVKPCGPFTTVIDFYR
jgi:hypothetical protein